jgi:prevent-host-death family protein
MIGGEMNNEELGNMVSITEFSKKPSQVLKKTESGSTQYILKNNKVVAVLMDIELYKTINEASALWSAEIDDNEWDNIIDYAQALLAVKRSETGGQEVKPLVWDELLSDRDFKTTDLK